MKHIVWAFIAVLAIAGGTGCNKMHGNLLHKNKVCSQCAGHGCPACGQGHGGHGGHHDMNAVHNQNGDPHYYGGQGGGGNCPTCGPNGANGGYIGQGPGQVAYPYYTTRGPRDFLMNNPPSLGP